MSTTKDRNRGFDNGVFDGPRRILGSQAEQQGYDAGRALFDANHAPGPAAASSRSPRVDQALAALGSILAVIRFALGAVARHGTAGRLGMGPAGSLVCAEIGGLMGAGLGFVFLAPCWRRICTRGSSCCRWCWASRSSPWSAKGRGLSAEFRVVRRTTGVSGTSVLKQSVSPLSWSRRMRSRTKRQLLNRTFRSTRHWPGRAEAGLRLRAADLPFAASGWRESRAGVEGPVVAESSRSDPQVRRRKADLRRRAEAEFSSTARRTADGRQQSPKQSRSIGYNRCKANPEIKIPFADKSVAQTGRCSFGRTVTQKASRRVTCEENA